ncbi:MAG: AAA family ATPase [Acidobacteria bacterium]|nr:AAA family ATPase [Acidobacteriota bacterium]
MIPQICRVYIWNYKSLAQVNVGLGPFCVFIGPNGSGKSNFIDALAFVHDRLSGSVELAFKNRGGISAVRRRSAGHPTHIGIRLTLDLDDNLSADYSFEIAAKPTEQFTIARERCVVEKEFMKERHEFDIEKGGFKKKIPSIRPRVSSDRLALFAASATEEFRPVYDFLTSMRLYSIVPVTLRGLQEPDPGEFLKPDGSNAAAVLKRIRDENQGGERFYRLCRLLSKVVQGVRKVEYRAVGQRETLQFKQEVGLKHPWTFEALNMSDGTLRALGLLLAVYQPGRPKVVMIEESEATIHPAVTELIVQVLEDASHERQVLLTTHSPDILDYKDLNDTQIRVVTMDRNANSIAPVSQEGRKAIRERLYTPGELFRSGELNPDLSEAVLAVNQMGLFGTPFPDKPKPH